MKSKAKTSQVPITNDLTIRIGLITTARTIGSRVDSRKPHTLRTKSLIKKTRIYIAQNRKSNIIRCKMKTFLKTHKKMGGKALIKNIYNK
jgi:hypothetical protein